MYGAAIVSTLPRPLTLRKTVLTQRVRNWYVGQAVAEGWSRNLLKLQIASQAHLRQGNAVTNFAARLPAPQSDLVQQALKDPDIFDFLTLQTGFQEQELETGLVQQLERFLLELAQGFAFVGRQYHLAVGESESPALFLLPTRPGLVRTLRTYQCILLDGGASRFAYPIQVSHHRPKPVRPSPNGLAGSCCQAKPGPMPSASHGAVRVTLRSGSEPRPWLPSRPPAIPSFP